MKTCREAGVIISVPGNGFLTGMFRSLRCRNFRLFFIGHGISLTGTWIQRIALPWFVYQKTGSSLMLGIVAFSGLVPSFILSPFAGVFIDRWDRFILVTATQILSLAQALLLVYFSFSGNLTTNIIIAVNIFSGIVNSFEMPARQVFCLEIIGNRNDYSNVMALNSLLVNGAKLAGPSAAALLISAGGISLCFLINGISYGAVIVSLLMMKSVPVKKKVNGRGLFHEMKEGFSFASGCHPARNILFLYGLICFAGWPFTVLMPAVAGDMLHGSSGTFSLLMASSGAGAFIGATVLGSRKKTVEAASSIARDAALLGISIVLLSFSRNLLLSMGLMAVNGACMMMLMAETVSFIQYIVEDNKRGRIMSCCTMIFTGAAPAGSYLAGNLSSKFGIQNTLLLGGIICVTGACMYLAVVPGSFKIAEFDCK